MNILGFDYEVVFAKMGDIDSLGHVNPKELCIAVSEDVDPQLQISTILHEIIEAINIHMDLKLKHSQITSLEVGLYSVLKDNGIDIQKFLNC
jgi:hypothetical protein